jgi:uncharacterized membrane protein
MTWLQRYRLRYYVKNAIWIYPLLAMVAGIETTRLLRRVDDALGLQAARDPDTARTVLGALSSSMFAFIVFVSSALLVAVQLASSQLTPRIIGTVFRDRVTKLSLTAFVFAFAFSLAALVGITNSVPLLTTYLAAYSCLASLGIFLFLLDHVGKVLRPSGALGGIGLMGREVIESVYPGRLGEPPAMPPVPAALLEGQPTGVVTNVKAGVVLAFDVRGIVALAQRADCVVQMVPQVGDFIAVGDPLFRVFHGKGAPLAEALRQSIAVGQERTLEQDPAFAFRIIVDIASKGLSPAINDPTTAVLAVDQIHHLLRTVGSRHLADGQVCDAVGQVRLVYRTPNWGDFVQLAVTEIRQFGGGSVQILRRLRAMLENLIQTLPPERVPLLRRELELLHRTAERFFTDPEDLALAEVSDTQGVGGKQGPGQGSRQTGAAPDQRRDISSGCKTG